MRSVYGLSQSTRDVAIDFSTVNEFMQSHPHTHFRITVAIPDKPGLIATVNTFGESAPNDERTITAGSGGLANGGEATMTVWHYSGQDNAMSGNIRAGDSFVFGLFGFSLVYIHVTVQAYVPLN